MKRISTPHKKHDAGFSLVELLAVCLITFILLAISVPAIQRTLLAYRLESISGLIGARLTEARMTALKHNRTALLKINETDRALEIWTTDQAGTQVRIGIVVKLPEGVVIDPSSALQVNFSSLGRNIAGYSVIRFSVPSAGQCRSMLINSVGNTAVTNGC